MNTATIRTFTVRLTISAFSLAALLGIWALLSEDPFSETASNVLMTTLLVGVISIAFLAYLTTAGTRWAWLGIIGTISALIPFAITMYGLWIDDPGDIAWRSTGTLTTVAATIAQISVLLVLGAKVTGRVRWLLYATIAMAVIVAGFIIYPIAFNTNDLGDWYLRSAGIAGILDALGTVTLIALWAFGTRDHHQAVGTGSAATTLSPALDSQLIDIAQRTGRSRMELIEEAVSKYVDGLS